MKACKQKKATCKTLNPDFLSLKYFLFIYHSQSNAYIYPSISYPVIRCIKKTARVGPS